MPSQADIQATRDIIAAGKVVKIELFDHVIMGRIGNEDAPPDGFLSLKELGCLKLWK